MDTNFAATVIAVVEEGSIAGAARRMAITAGAVALRIKAVEAEVGADLFTRAGRQVAPTPAAARLLEPLRALVASTADLKRVAKSHESVVGELRLGTIATACTGVLPSLLKSLAHDYPHLDIFVEPGTSLDLRERVLDGALDAALMLQPPDALRKGETFEPWVAEPLVLIAPGDTREQDPIVLLRTRQFIRYDRKNWGGRIVDDYLRRSAIVPHDRIELDALDAIVALVSEGLGVAIIPDWAGSKLAHQAIVRLALPPPVPSRVLGLYSRSSSARLDLIRLLAATYAGRAAVDV